MVTYYILFLLFYKHEYTCLSLIWFSPQNSLQYQIYINPQQEIVPNRCTISSGLVDKNEKGAAVLVNYRDSCSTMSRLQSSRQ